MATPLFNVGDDVKVNCPKWHALIGPGSHERVSRVQYVWDRQNPGVYTFVYEVTCCGLNEKFFPVREEELTLA